MRSWPGWSLARSKIPEVVARGRLVMIRDQTSLQGSYKRAWNHSPGNLSVTPAFRPNLQMTPKRVILRLRESHFPNISYSEIVTCVKSFLTFTGRPAEEADQGKHFWHFQPPSGGTSEENPRFHIVIDFDQFDHSGLLPEYFPHEIYHVTKIENEMWVNFFHMNCKESETYHLRRRIISFRNKMEQDNFLRKLRHYSDDFYPWGQDIGPSK